MSETSTVEELKAINNHLKNIERIAIIGVIILVILVVIG
jgi:hypothetical protein